MSILLKKLNTKKDLPENLADLTELFGKLHLAMCTSLSDLMQDPWVPDRIDLEFDELKTFVTSLPETGVFMGFSRFKSPCMCLTSFDPKVAAAVSAQSLGMSELPNAKDYEPGRLVTLLFKPAQQTLETQLRALISVLGDEALNDIMSCEQDINMQSFNLSFTPETWCLMTFFMKRNDDNINAAATPNKKPKKRANLETNRLSYKILLPLSLIRRIISAAEAGQSDAFIDPENPWTQHMRESVDKAVVPVRAVVETFRMTVAECTRLEIGSVIDLPGVSLQSIGLQTESGDEKTPFAHAALGIYKSHRAVKLTEDLHTAFLPESGLLNTI